MVVQDHHPQWSWNLGEFPLLNEDVWSEVSLYPGEAIIQWLICADRSPGLLVFTQNNFEQPSYSNPLPVSLLSPLRKQWFWCRAVCRAGLQSASDSLICISEPPAEKPNLLHQVNLHPVVYRMGGFAGSKITKAWQADKGDVGYHLLQSDCLEFSTDGNWWSVSCVSDLQATAPVWHYVERHVWC